MISSKADFHDIDRVHPASERGEPFTQSAAPLAADRQPAPLQTGHTAEPEHQPATCAILLVAPEPSAGVVADALRRELNIHVHTAAGGKSGLAAMRREDFTLIVLEENLAAAEPEVTEALFTMATTAPVLEINFGLCGVERIVRQVRSALERRTADEAKARLAVSNSLVNELNASLAGLLLESQLAVRQASPEVLPALQHLIHLASELRTQLRP